MDVKDKGNFMLTEDMIKSIENTNIKEKLNYIKKLSDREDLILFVSFDLVNSSSYKTRNYTSWFPIFINIIEQIKKYVLQEINNSQLWRTIGDEAVFIVNITERVQLENSIQSVFEILNNTITQIKNGMILGKNFNQEERNVFIAQNALSLKATAWIAPVNSTSSELKKNTANIHNLMYMYNHNGDDGLPTYEFQGNDIDTGFRLSKNTRERRLTLSLELAYLLSENQLIDPKINIVSYKSLRGIWSDKIYPIIWYHDENYVQSKLKDSFFYDEYYTDDITKEYIDNQYDKINFVDKNTTFQKLHKIIYNKNMMSKIDYIKNMLNDNYKNEKLIKGSRLLEVHCVAICVNLKEKKVLMFKRSESANIYKDKWDFGCCEIQSGQSFKENLEKDYKRKFNLSIEVLDPIKDYYFQNSDKKTIPGIRFIAIITDDININIEDSNYKKEYKYITFEEFKNISEDKKEEYLDYKQFLEVVLAVENYAKLYV